MSVLTSTDNQQNLPRYFARVFNLVGKLNSGRVDFILPDGRQFRAEGAKPGPVAEVFIKNPDVFARLVREGDLGFSDAYLDGWWTTPDLQAFMDFIHADNDDMYDEFPGMGLVRAWEKARFWLQSNSKRQALKNISYHYDLGNDFYRLWLDDTMTYSSALFTTSQESLENAQVAKYASMIDQMGVKPGDHVLEIGCGWGGFAEYAAKERGLKVTGLTISKEQLDFARKRINNNGLGDKVNLKLQDYRDETGVYDGVASIEMFEAVGEKYWPIYFNKVKQCLKPGKQATLQIITIHDARWEVYRKGVDFIQKYIFPGGYTPSLSEVVKPIEKSGLMMSDLEVWRMHYSHTLRHWKERFLGKREKVLEMFDEKFLRMWEFYLAGCEMAFKWGDQVVYQFQITKNYRSTPVTRDYIYQ